MEDLAGFIIQSIANKAKEAQAEAAQQQLARGRQGSPVLPAAGTRQLQPVARVTARPAATRVPSAPTAGATARLQAANAAQNVERDAALVIATAAAAYPVPRLLAPFVHPHALLAAIVVSEALQPPLALRQRERP